MKDCHLSFYLIKECQQVFCFSLEGNNFTLFIIFLHQFCFAFFSVVFPPHGHQSGLKKAVNTYSVTFPGHRGHEGEVTNKK